MDRSYTPLAVRLFALAATLLVLAAAPAGAAQKPKLIVISPSSQPAPAGKVDLKATLRVPAALKVRRVRFYANGKLITTDRRPQFKIKRRTSFDTRKLNTTRPYVTIKVRYEFSGKRGRTVRRELTKRVRIRFRDTDVGAKGESMFGFPLVLDEEFNGDSLDRSIWNDQRFDSIDEDTPGKPAMSRPFNTDEGAAYGPDNVSVGNGILSLELRDSPAPDPSAAAYARSTGMVNTRGKFAFKYGYVETRAWVPEEMGSWPTFWMMPASGDAWPPEIDVFEYVYIPEYPARFPHAVFHWSPDGPEGDDQFQWDTSETSSIPSPKPQEWFTTRPVGDTYDINYMGQWHTYGLLWLPDRADVYVDGQYRLSVRGASKLPQQPMYLIYQMAIMKASLNRGVPPAGSAMKVDYLRVYSNAG